MRACGEWGSPRPEAGGACQASRAREDPPDRAEGLPRSLSLALPGAGGVQRAFGTDAKSLQVGFAADAGVRAARLAAAGAGADPAALDAWLPLMGGDRARLDADAFDPTAAAVPGGLATKIFPCCYAKQRPIGAVRALLAEAPLDPATVDRITVRTPAAAVHPLLHSRPTTGLHGKFSLEYAVAAALLDGQPGFDSFTDEAVRRPEARRLVESVETVLTPEGSEGLASQEGSGGSGLLTGATTVEVRTTDAAVRRATLTLPPGSPDTATGTERGRVPPQAIRPPPPPPATAAAPPRSR